MAQIYDKDGIIILESKFYNLKIDNNRKVYIKKKDRNQYESIDYDLPQGMTIDEKKIWLANFNQKLEIMYLEKLNSKPHSGFDALV